MWALGVEVPRCPRLGGRLHGRKGRVALPEERGEAQTPQGLLLEQEEGVACPG